MQAWTAQHDPAYSARLKKRLNVANFREDHR
jgi:hypothetical protein